MKLAEPHPSVYLLPSKGSFIRYVRYTFGSNFGPFYQSLRLFDVNVLVVLVPLLIIIYRSFNMRP